MLPASDAPGISSQPHPEGGACTRNAFLARTCSNILRVLTNFGMIRTYFHLVYSLTCGAVCCSNNLLISGKRERRGGQ